MSCEVAALPFQAHVNYETWSISLKPIDDFLCYELIAEQKMTDLSLYYLSLMLALNMIYIT